MFSSAFLYQELREELHMDRIAAIDWLRVILIFAVFLHHVFMPFNGDGWHIMNEESSKVLDNTMVYFEQLRLQSLFFIAGLGCTLLLNKMSVKAFLTNKFHRLFIPLLVGMILIIPPQEYYENITKYTSLADAYQQNLFSFSANHLWFIEFLIVFMLLAVPIHYFIASKRGQTVSERLAKLADNKHGLFSLVIIFLMTRFCLKLLMPSQETSLSNVSVSLFFLLFFIVGMLLISHKTAWQALGKYRRTNLSWFLLSTILFIAWFNKPDISEYVSLEIRWQMYWAVCTLVSWTGLLAMLGYATYYLNHSPKWLRSANELIYPFYILHQTIIVVLGYYIIQWQASIPVKSLSLLFSALTVCIIVCWLLIKPFKLPRYLFGLRSIKTQS